jgi:hypothetical protein
MYSIGWLNNINKTDILPPLTVKKSVKQTEKWKIAVLDSFEHIGKMQFEENFKFWDYYRMVNGEMSYQELRQVLPQLRSINDLLDGAEIPAFLQHYDVLGAIIRDIVGKYVDMQDKFHVIDNSEVAQNEYMRMKDEEIQRGLMDIIQSNIELHLAKNGLTLDGKQFESPEEQQAYVQKIQQVVDQATPKDTEKASRAPFKNAGVRWGEATLEKDKEDMHMLDLEKENLRDKLLTGRCFREYRIGYDHYQAVNWSPKNTFFSKEVSTKFTQYGEYIGRLQPATPSEVIKKYGHEISTEKQRELLGGNENWKSFVGDGILSSTIEEGLKHNFNKPMWVPFNNFPDYNFYLGLQDELGIPMGTAHKLDENGVQRSFDRFLPKYNNRNSGSHDWIARVLRDDFTHRTDLCLETQVYFIAYELFGFLTYETESGLLVTEQVTEDILPELIKDKGIKQTYKVSIVDVIKSIKDLQPNTLKWMWKPVCYEGVKIQSGNLQEPLYLYCRPCENQIKGKGELDVLLPVAGYVGQALAPKIMPYQAGFNLCMNQIRNLLEKEVGIFFLLDVSLIPSEIDGWGDAQEALISMRNMANDISILPVQTSGDMQKNQNNFNQFTTHNLSHAGQVQYRIGLAMQYKQLAYEVVGSNPQAALNPTKYETAEGVRLGQESSHAQIAEIFQEFSDFNKEALTLHLAVAQYCQSNNKDISVIYTKSDQSIEFLKLYDPNFPLRRFGISPSKDGRKRKDLENFKQYMFQNNTIGNDLLEAAELMSCDSMSQALEIAKVSQMRRDQAGREQFEREQEAIKNKILMDDEVASKGHERKLIEIAEQNKGKVMVAGITAEGRAADNKADPAFIESIKQSTARGIKEAEIESKTVLAHEKIEATRKTSEDTFKIKMQELSLKAKELEMKNKKIEADKYIATVNKN